MNLDKHIQLAEIFLIANSIFAVALADARNEKLKTGISIAGLVISFGWMWCTCVPVTDDDVGQVVEVLTVCHTWRWQDGLFLLGFTRGTGLVGRIDERGSGAGSLLLARAAAFRLRMTEPWQHPVVRGARSRMVVVTSLANETR